MNSNAVFWSRLLLCVVCVLFLLMYTSQYANFRQQYSNILHKYSQSLTHNDGLAAQLRVMAERNERIQRMINEIRSKNTFALKETVEKYRQLESTNDQCWKKLKECDTNAQMLKNVTSDTSENVQKYEAEIADLKRQLEETRENATRLEQEKLELNNLLQKAEQSLQQLQSEKDDCLLRQQTGNKTPAPLNPLEQDHGAEVLAAPDRNLNYVQNGEAQFSRSRSANEVLAFERNIANNHLFEQPVLLPNKELFEKLSKKKQQHDAGAGAGADADAAAVHPQDINNEANGAEVMEPPDSNEGDYKEMQ